MVRDAMFGLFASRSRSTFARLPALFVAAALLAGCPSPPETPTQAASAPKTAASAATGPAKPAGPDAPRPAFKKPVTDVYQGVSLTDDYRWLEDGDDPAVKAWCAAENAFARRFLDKTPDRESIRSRLKALMGFQTPDWFAA